jgi:cell division protein FtsB
VATRKATKTRPAGKAGTKREAAKKRTRPQRSTILLRWCILATAALVGVLYYQPLSSYVETRSALEERETEVAQLRAERNRLQQRLADSSTLEALSREARRMSLVRPGERLYIVKGIDEWRRANAKTRTTIGRDG